MHDLARKLEEQVNMMDEKIGQMADRRVSSSSTNTVRIEGAGSIWNGLAVGIALGAVIMGGAWIVSTQQRVEVLSEQARTYHAAVYMLAPRFAEEIDKEISRKKEE